MGEFPNPWWQILQPWCRLLYSLFIYQRPVCIISKTLISLRFLHSQFSYLCRYKGHFLKNQCRWEVSKEQISCSLSIRKWTVYYQPTCADLILSCFGPSHQMRRLQEAVTEGGVVLQEPRRIYEWNQWNGGIVGTCQPLHPSEGSTWKNSHSEALGNNVTAERQQLPTAPSPLVGGG